MKRQIQPERLQSQSIQHERQFPLFDTQQGAKRYCSMAVGWRAWRESYLHSVVFFLIGKQQMWRQETFHIQQLDIWATMFGWCTKRLRASHSGGTFENSDRNLWIENSEGDKLDKRYNLELLIIEEHFLPADMVSICSRCSRLWIQWGIPSIANRTFAVYMREREIRTCVYMCVSLSGTCWAQCVRVWKVQVVCLYLSGQTPIYI